MPIAPFEEMAQTLSADASFMRRTRRIVRRHRLKRLLDHMLEGMTALAVLWP
jgi:hypothetical protein